MAYTLARPITDNRAEFKRRWPKANYLGDVGDLAHMEGTGDHTPYSTDRIFGMGMRQGTVYAQDFGDGFGFDQAMFTRWLLTQLRSGAYPEVKYVISRHQANAGFVGGVYFGLFDRRYSWRTQRAVDHAHHVHISYMPGYENRPSRIMADYWVKLHQVTPDPQWKRWTGAPKLPAFTLGRFSARTLDSLPYPAWPPIVLGYGGQDSPAAQRDFVMALQEYAVKDTKTILIPKAELDRGEIGPGTMAWAKSVVTKAGNPWANDPARNGRALGASLGAPAHW